jgi:threonyl-tRNA synthetase
VTVDDAKDSVGKKVRAAELLKVPYVVVVGDRDLGAGTFTIRDRTGEQTAGVSFDRIVEALVEEDRERRLTASSFAAG